jgi:hypothetical protein
MATKSKSAKSRSTSTRKSSAKSKSPSSRSQRLDVRGAPQTKSKETSKRKSTTRVTKPKHKGTTPSAGEVKTSTEHRVEVEVQEPVGSDLSNEERDLYLFVRRRPDTVATIAEKANLDKDKTRRLLKKMEEKLAVKVVENGDTRYRR